MQHNNFFSLEQIIDRQPLTVAPETPLIEVIRQMQEWANSCYLTESDDASDPDSTRRINNSCALVIEDAQLQGIFTERDLVRLIATERDLAGIAIGEVMSRELNTLTATGSEDVFMALNLLRQQQIRHLPIIDESEHLLGLITEKNLRQNLQPIDLMKWRRVEEVMSDRVIHSPPTISVRQAAKLMAEHRVSYVAIVESDKERDGLLIPVGIITERDIVQFQALNFDFSQPVQQVMSSPLFLVNPEHSLWTIHQLMQQRRVRRLLVAGVRGELRGIITQTRLLQVFDPTEMYGVVEILQRQQTEPKLRIQARQQEAIVELGQYALAQNNLVLLMERAVNLVTDLLDVEYCQMLELQPDGKNLLLKAGVGWHDGLVGVTTVRADTNSQAGYTLLSSESVVVTDLLSETRFSGSNLLLDHQVVSGMNVIILDDDRPFGVLGVHTTRHRFFSQDDLNFVQAIAKT